MHSDSPSILQKTLDGLLKHAHLINVDMFPDLLKVLYDISVTQHKAFIDGGKTRVGIVPALGCIVSALELVDKSLGQALNVDMQGFYGHLYTLMMRLASLAPLGYYLDNSDSENSAVSLLSRGVDLMFKKHRQVSLTRIAAFSKRLVLLALTAPWHTSTVAYLQALSQAMKLFPQLDSFFDDEPAAGVYHAFLDDPDQCNPFASLFWELPLIRRHYHPMVSSVASTKQTLLLGKNLKGASKGFTMSPEIHFSATISKRLARFRKAKHSGRINGADGPTAIQNSSFVSELNETFIKH